MSDGAERGPPEVLVGLGERKVPKYLDSTPSPVDHASSTFRAWIHEIVGRVEEEAPEQTVDVAGGGGDPRAWQRPNRLGTNQGAVFRHGEPLQKGRGLGCRTHSV